MIFRPYLHLLLIRVACISVALFFSLVAPIAATDSPRIDSTTLKAVNPAAETAAETSASQETPESSDEKQLNFIRLTPDQRIPLQFGLTKTTVLDLRDAYQHLDDFRGKPPILRLEDTG
ncbi:MAG: hypothetical protein ACRCUY_10955, partial [Thermoguttaceae bacterium]